MNDKKHAMWSIVLAVLVLGAGGYYFFGSGGDSSTTTTSIEKNIRKAPSTELVAGDQAPRHHSPPVESQASPGRHQPDPVRPRPTNTRRPPRRDRHPNVKKITLPPAA